MNTEKTVLHVDDDPDILAIVKLALEKKGYRVISISDPTTAIDILSKTGIRVAILDIDMPEMDGLTLLREIKQRDTGIKTIMLTGMVSMSTVLSATSLGAEEFLGKPVKNLNEVVLAVDRCFANINSWWNALSDWMEHRSKSLKKPWLKSNPARSIVGQ
ncbi:MAG: response regulator [Pirellula sp.]|jgi:two-component system NtrC family response regulator|nr:response regulator [Pirellula sp.]